MKYRSEIDLTKLIKAAKAELRDSWPEEYKVLLLAVGAKAHDESQAGILAWFVLDGFLGLCPFEVISVQKK